MKGRKKIVYEGIYELPEAASFLRTSMSFPSNIKITSSKLIYWIRQGLSLQELTKIHGREMLIAFEDLISMRIIASLRASGVSFNKIYAAEKWLRETTKHPRPFATQALWTEKSEVFTELQFRLITASKHGQYAMDIIREYLIPIHGLTFDESGIAETWEPYKNIVLRPQIQFGSPCIKGTRIPTRTIWGMVIGGDTIDFIASSYKLDASEIEAAVEWERTLIPN